MKTKSILRRILCFMLVGCILFSSVFLSYSNTLQVQASDDYFEDAEIVRTALDISLVVLGLIGIIYSGGVITTSFVVDSMLSLWGGADLVVKNLKDNGDGTYTIDEAFIQQVVDSIPYLENSTFNDDNAESMGKGGYTYSVCGYAVTTNIYKNLFLTKCMGSFTRSVSVGSNRIAGWINDKVNDAVYFYSFSSVFGSVSVPVVRESYKDGVLQSSKETQISAMDTRTSANILDCAYSVNFPVFTDYDACENYVKTGEGYKDALNYAEKPPISVSSIYNGSWSGGNITVSKKVLNNVINKVEELNNNTNLTTDEKVNQLIIFINSGGEDGGDDPGGGGGTGGGEDDEVIEGDSWLEKIFNVLMKIWGKVKTIPEDIAKVFKFDLTNEKVESLLDDILDTLKSIRRWTIADTIIDGVDFVESLIVDTAGLVTDLVKDPLDAFGSVMSMLDSIGDAFKVKFPFCIPWDIEFLLDLFSASPKAPYYELPLKYGSKDSLIYIDETIVVDMEPFSIISRICRTFLTIVFCKCLLDLTVKAVNLKEQEYKDS